MAKTITLNTPLIFDGAPIATLEIRNPKARDFRTLTGLDKPFGMMLDLASSLTGLPATVLDELDAGDFSQVMEIMGGFLAPFQATGKMSSATSPTSSISLQNQSGS